MQAKIAEREKGRNKSDGQLGRKDEALKQVAFPDVVITHSISHCPDCAMSCRQICPGKYEINPFLNHPHPPFGHLLPPAGEGKLSSYE